jgi:hypothetical protein
MGYLFTKPLARCSGQVKQEYPPGGRAFADHVNVFAEGLVIICLVDGCVSITFYIVVKRYFLITHQLFKVIPVPFGIGRPFFGKIFDHHWYSWFIKFLPEDFRINCIVSGNRP